MPPNTATSKQHKSVVDPTYVGSEKYYQNKTRESMYEKHYKKTSPTNKEKTPKQTNVSSAANG